jgi:hypothetical protein
MAPWVKLMIGLAAALAAAAIHHGPLGHGEAFVRTLEAQAEQVVRRADIAGVEVRMQRDPLGRTAILSGPADRFQREGQGSFPGLNERVAGIRGIGAVAWTDEGGSGGLRLPLLAETLLLALGAWLIGLGLGFLLFGRRRLTSYLGD